MWLDKGQSVVFFWELTVSIIQTGAHPANNTSFSKNNIDQNKGHFYAAIYAKKLIID